MGCFGNGNEGDNRILAKPVPEEAALVRPRRSRKDLPIAHSRWRRRHQAGKVGSGANRNAEFNRIANSQNIRGQFSRFYN